MCAALVLVGAAVFGIPVAGKLSAGGYLPPDSESAWAARVLAETFHRGDMQLWVTVTSGDGPSGSAGAAVGTDIAGRLEQSPYVTDVTSPWTAPPKAAKELISRDGKTGLIVAGMKGGENDAPKYARSLVHDFAHSRDGVKVRAGGMSMTYAQINSQITKDLWLMESISIPMSFLVLVWVFGGLLAAVLPIAVGVLAIAGTLAVLRLIAFWTDVSIFALNFAVAMGLALAIDYTLLIISRYREELDKGHTVEQALLNTIPTAGRTVVFSAVTVGLSMGVMVIFPQYFLKSFAYVGAAVVFFAVTAAVLVTPAAIVLLAANRGRHHLPRAFVMRADRLDTFDVRRLIRRVLGRAEPSRPSAEQSFWYRAAKIVMRHAVVIIVVGTAFLVLLGVPFLGIRWGLLDDRVLPPSTSARQVGDELRNGFASDLTTAVTVVVPDIGGLAPDELEKFAARLSLAVDVSSVSAPAGTYAQGVLTGPPSAATGVADDSAFLTVASTAPLYSRRSTAQLNQLHAIGGPQGRRFELTGVAEQNQDGVDAVTTRLPLALSMIAVITFVLLFLLTGSVVLPIKALILNVLSLTAAFGALVWIFQEGHVGGLGTTATGTLNVGMPVLMFCIAFGLSMDYEVFLIARIREYWLASDHTAAANDESVALGLARTGRVITAAALIMSISFAALAAAQVAFMRMFGFGLTLAVLVDATLVRMILVPALMHVMGQYNWWAPRRLAGLHARFGINEEPTDKACRSPR
jgi:RND superfamily putative drug exporter